MFRTNTAYLDALLPPTLYVTSTTTTTTITPKEAMSVTPTVTLTITYGDPDLYVVLSIADRLRNAARNRGATIYVDDARTVGEWQGEPEHSGVIVFELPTRYLLAMRLIASALATEYSQDALGFLVCDTPSDQRLATPHLPTQEDS